MTFDHILLFSQKYNLPTCDSFRSDGSHMYMLKSSSLSMHLNLHVCYLS